MSLRLGVSLVVCLVLAEVGYGAEPEGAPAENAPRQREVVCHCQFVELSPRAVEDFFAAADVVTARSAAKGGPEFGVCRRAEVALGKLSLGGCAKRFDWPPVVATSEKPASVLSGGEFPILIPVADGRVAVQWKRFGYRAEVVPRWLEAGRLQLDITPEIASKDFSHAVTANGLTIPGLTTRRVCARVEMNLGETAVINLGPVPTNPDDEPTPAPSQPDRPATSRTSERSRSKHPAAERTITLFLVTPTAARPASGANVEP
jgi:hypothetical protein